MQPPAVRPSTDREPDVREYVDTVIGARWLILCTTIAALLGGVAYLFFATPTYQADALVQVEERKSTIAGLDDLSTLFNSQSPAETEIEIIRSRMLVGSVVDELRLETVAEPRYLPYIGKGIARRHRSDTPAPPLLGLSSYAWGGERIAIDHLEVPRTWIGRPLTLIARDAGHYDVLDPDRAPLARGEVGKALVSGSFSLLVLEVVARPATEFVIASISRSDLIESLQNQIAASEKGKKTGIIRIAMEGPDPERVARTVDAIAKTYLRQNVERKSAEAEKTLQFITGQLPQLKSNVEKAEAALKGYRKDRGGGIDMSLETKAALDRTTEIERMLTELSMHRTEMQLRFMPGHPAVEALNRKASQLQAERAAIDKQMKGLPETELQAARLTRDVKVSSELYVLLMNKAQELQVMKSGTVGNVRILDAPDVPRRPVRPAHPKTFMLSIALGAVLGIAIAFARKALDPTVDDPDAIEQQTGFPVIATIPHSSAERDSMQVRKGRARPASVLAVTTPTDLAVEALRSLRTSIQVSLADARNNVVAIAGPSPGIGKSFVAVNLAHVAADVGKRVLLVDADMRKGRLHDSLGTNKAPGLSDLIRGAAAPKDAIRTTPTQNLFFLPSGTRPSNPSELLSSSSFQDVITSFMRDFDLVLVDTPPILAVTDAALAGRMAAITLVVLRAEHHAIREIKLAIRRLEQNSVVPRAIVLNDVMPKTAGYSRYHYHYDYK